MLAIPNNITNSEKLVKRTSQFKIHLTNPVKVSQWIRFKKLPNTFENYVVSNVFLTNFEFLSANRQ